MKREQKGRTPGIGMAAGNRAESQIIRKRSVTIAGHRTSISLEDAFWAVLCRIAASRGRSVSDLVTQIDRKRSGNLSSAIRVFVLTEVAAGFDAGASFF